MDITDEQVLELTADCDEDGNGEIDFSEFAGMMAKNFTTRGLGQLGAPEEQVRLGPVVSLLKQCADERGGEDVKKIRNCFDLLGVDFFDKKTIGSEVSYELCRQMSYKTLKPFQVFNKQGESAANYVFVMAGAVACTLTLSKTKISHAHSLILSLRLAHSALSLTHSALSLSHYA